MDEDGKIGWDGVIERISCRLRSDLVRRDASRRERRDESGRRG